MMPAPPFAAQGKPPGGFEAGAHFSAGLPKSLTPVGSDVGERGLQPVKVMLVWPRMVMSWLQ